MGAMHKLATEHGNKLVVGLLVCLGTTERDAGAYLISRNDISDLIFYYILFFLEGRTCKNASISA
jgi:hypothetical protein